MVITLKRKNMALYPRYVGVRMTWELQARLGVAAQRQKTGASDLIRQIVETSLLATDKKGR